MKYMVMECHLSYAVVLDEEGRFLKVANRHYEVGQTVSEVVEMVLPQSKSQKKKSKKWMYSLAAMAACMILIMTSAFQMGQVTCASVYMTINPEVRIDVNKKDVVVDLQGINDDGEDLLEGYHFKKKKLDLVMDELIDRAIDKGYLYEGGQISLVLDSENGEWIVSHSETLTNHLNDYLSEKLTVKINISDEKETDNSVTLSTEIDKGDNPDAVGEEEDDRDDEEEDESDDEEEDDSEDEEEDDRDAGEEDDSDDEEEVDSDSEEEDDRDAGEENESDSEEEDDRDAGEEDDSDDEEEVDSDSEEEDDRDAEEENESDSEEEDDRDAGEEDDSDAGEEDESDSEEEDDRDAGKEDDSDDEEEDDSDAEEEDDSDSEEEDDRDEEEDESDDEEDDSDDE